MAERFQVGYDGVATVIKAEGIGCLRYPVPASSEAGLGSTPRIHAGFVFIQGQANEGGTAGVKALVPSGEGLFCFVDGEGGRFKG